MKLKPLCIIFSISISAGVWAHLPTQEDTIENRTRLKSVSAPKCFAIPEGGFVYSFNPSIEGWLIDLLDVEKIKTIRTKLKSFLKIPLTQEGFTMASSRKTEEEVDPTAYSAVWVRDCCWQYYGLKTIDKSSAKRLILRLLDFYSSDNQVNRFLAVIKNPILADPKHNPNAAMSVPLIRFSSKTMSHHQIDGKDQPWNHLQFDAHGLFLLALSDALISNIICSDDFKPQYYDILILFPAFFTLTDYTKRKDAGPWEEELLDNASTVGLIASGQKTIMNVIRENSALNHGFSTALQRLKTKLPNPKLGEKIQQAVTPENINTLYQAGLNRVERNLNLGGEAPDITGNGIDRRADVALLFLCLSENSLFHNDTKRIREILNITLSLVGPYGVYRYRYDAYQAANYWIDYQVPSAIFGPKTPELLFVTRFHKGYVPTRQPYDAQWFFDSNFAQIYYHLSLLEKEPEVQCYYMRKGDLHLKRALGQLTGPNAHAANGEALPMFQLPESINTVIDAKMNFHPMPSPICPLGWATAAMMTALENAEKTHSVIEKR